MNRTTKEKDSQQRQKRTKRTAPEEAGEKENQTKQEERETDNIFKILEEKILNNIKKLSEIEMPKVNFGVLFVRIDKVHKSIRDFDAVISSQVNRVSTKVIEYVKESIEDYKKNKVF